MTEEEHQKIIEGIPKRYEKTNLGNYTPGVVKEIVTDALNSYRFSVNAPRPSEVGEDT